MRPSALVFAIALTPFIAHAQGAPAAPRCGDGVLQPGEACDDGNNKSGDGCSYDCRARDLCGDGVLQPGEVCDDGNNLPGDGCSPLCQAEVSSCGDGIVVALEGEECDDGNRVDGDGCNSRCQITACGDGAQELIAGEECDDGNTFNGDGCSHDCRREVVAPAISRTRPPGRTKSPGLALGLALGGTVATSVLFFATANQEGATLFTTPLAVVGPSLGHFYTGDIGRGAMMSGLRLGLTGAVAGLGFLALLNSSNLDGALGNFVAFSILTGGTYYSLALVDIIHAPLSAQRFNERPVSGSPEVVGLPFKPKPSISLWPTPLRGPDGSAGLGLLLGGRL